MRVGDQLLAVNGKVVVGQDFDSIMGQLQEASGSLDLVLYRGPVSALFTVLKNQIGEDSYVREADDDEGEEEVIMDENYVSPVKVEVKEKKPLTPGDFLKAAQKLLADNGGDKKSAPPPKKTGGGGFFGIGGESIQLEGDDAKGLK